MAEGNGSEPTIEEILASIRKIISDDDAEPETVEQPKVAAVPEDEAWPESNDEDDVLELTEMVSEDKPAEPEPSHHEAAPEQNYEPDPIRTPVLSQATTMNNNDAAPEDGGIITERAMAAASGAFAKLTHVDEPPEGRSSGDGRTVEDITKELLRPMLRQWIDQNLPQIVERLVERELRKISRKAEDL
jgi:cell pole-organizing protein PopZ